MQSLDIFADVYVRKDQKFFFQTFPDGQRRWRGDSIGEIFTPFFYGHPVGITCVKSAYDFEMLSIMFQKYGFGHPKEMKFREKQIGKYPSNRQSARTNVFPWSDLAVHMTIYRTPLCRRVT